MLTKHVVYGLIAAQVLMASSYLFLCPVQWTFKKCKSGATSAVVYLDFTPLEDLDVSSEKRS